MIPYFARNYDGSGPHYEVWYGKVDVAPGQALWFRYTILDGARREASTWAVLFDGDETFGGREFWPVEALDEAHTVKLPAGREPARFLRRRQVFRIDDGVQLDEANALGRAGEVSWDLQWRDSGRRFRYVPRPFFDLGLAKSTYDACLLDLRASGVVRCGERRLELRDRPAMIGHIQGRAISGDSWAWAHCNSFDDAPDAVFEGLSVKLRPGARPLCAFVLHVDGERHAFRTLRSLLWTKSRFERDGWRFEAEAGGVRLTGEARAPGRERVALVEYVDTDDSRLWCHNSKLAGLELRLVDPVRGIDRRLRSPQASAFEFVTREAPVEPVLLPARG